MFLCGGQLFFIQSCSLIFCLLYLFLSLLNAIFTLVSLVSCILCLVCYISGASASRLWSHIPDRTSRCPASAIRPTWGLIHLGPGFRATDRHGTLITLKNTVVVFKLQSVINNIVFLKYSRSIYWYLFIYMYWQLCTVLRQITNVYITYIYTGTRQRQFRIRASVSGSGRGRDFRPLGLRNVGSFLCGWRQSSCESVLFPAR